MMTQDDFVAHAAILVEKHFPKGKCAERGEAMVLVADMVLMLTERNLLK